MSLRRWILPIAVFVALSQVSFAQTNDWATVKLLLPSQKVKVMTADGKSYAGSIQSVTDDSIRIGKNQLIQKQDVRQILLRTPGHRGRNALIGAGIGAAVGLGVGAATGCGKNGNWCFVSRGEAIAVLTPFFGGAGAGIGALLPSHGGWHEVYRSK
jgi:hypothetical protein